MTWSCDGDIKSSHISQKTEAALYWRDAVRPDAVEDHNVFFSSLKGIYSIDLDIAELAVYLAEPRTKGVLQILNLCFVGGDYSDFASQALLKRLALGNSLVNEADKVQCESYLVQIDFWNVLNLLSRFDKIEKYTATNHIW